VRERARRAKPADRRAVVRELRQHFLETYSQHELPLVWFDSEINEVFDIDVFASEFPREVGFKTYRSSMAELLMLRFEDLRDSAPKALSHFLGIRNFELQRHNESGSKWYGDLYREFVDTVELPADYVDRLVASRMARLFWSEEKRARLRDRWVQRETRCHCDQGLKGIDLKRFDER
jgi:hypothetical protein